MAEPESKTVLARMAELDEFDGLALADVTPPLEKWWFQYPHLLKLNLLLLSGFLAQFTCGFDGSMINGMQSLPSWVAFFGNPQGAALGQLVNAINFGVIASVLVSSQLCEWFGRRRPISVGTFLVVFGSALQGGAQTYGMFFAGRFVIGVGTGITAVAAPQIMMECAYPLHRGKIVSLYMTQWVVGYLVAAWMTYGTFQVDSVWSWRLPSLVQAAPALLQFVLSWFVPESPRWLVYKDRVDEAVRMLARYHTPDNNPTARLVRFEMLEIQTTLEAEKLQRASSWKEFFATKGTRKRLSILLFIGYAVQISGLGLTGYYLTKILDSIGITDAKTQLLINAYLSLFQLACSVSFALLIDRIGRRGLITSGFTTMLVVFVVWTVCSAINQERDFADKSLAIAVVAMIFLFQVGYQQLAVVSVPYVVETSLFSLRAKTAMIFQFCGYTASLYNGYVNPIALENIGWRYYIFAVAILAFETVFAWWFLPETKGKGLEEIGEAFDDGELITGTQAIHQQRTAYHDNMDTAVPLSTAKSNAGAEVIHGEAKL